MICYLCRKGTKNGIFVFSEKGVELNICVTIEKHFWFQFPKNDPLICNDCWSKVKDFDLFYTQIQDTHQMYIKTEPKETDVTHTLPDNSLEMYRTNIKTENELLENEANMDDSYSNFNDWNWKTEREYMDEDDTGQGSDNNRDKDYLLNQNGNACGGILSKQIPSHIMAQSQDPKNQKKHIKKKQVETMNLQNLNNILSESSNRDYILLEEGPMKIPSQCENCRSCVCKEWTSRITPEYVQIFGLHHEALKKHLMKLDPSADLAKPDLIELYPDTKVFVKQTDIDTIAAKSNKKRAFVRNIVIHLVGGEDNLLNSKTAETLNSQNENIRTAVIGYMKKNFKMTLTVKEFNNIINHKISFLRKNKQMTEEEREEHRLDSIRRARESRIKKKNAKKRKMSITSDNESINSSASVQLEKPSFSPPHSFLSPAIKEEAN